MIEIVINIEFLFGGFMKLKCIKLLIFSFFSCSIIDFRLDRRISGYVLFCIFCLYVFFVYRRKYFSGFVRLVRFVFC